MICSAVSGCRHLQGVTPSTDGILILEVNVRWFLEVSCAWAFSHMRIAISVNFLTPLAEKRGVCEDVFGRVAGDGTARGVCKSTMLGST